MLDSLRFHPTRCRKTKENGHPFRDARLHAALRGAYGQDAGLVTATVARLVPSVTVTVTAVGNGPVTPSPRRRVICSDVPETTAVTRGLEEIAELPPVPPTTATVATFAAQVRVTAAGEIVKGGGVVDPAAVFTVKVARRPCASLTTRVAPVRQMFGLNALTVKRLLGEVTCEGCADRFGSVFWMVNGANPSKIKMSAEPVPQRVEVAPVKVSVLGIRVSVPGGCTPEMMNCSTTFKVEFTSIRR